jgi:nucleoside phosphorylase
MADIHLYRARLFFREEHYPWESPQKDLTEARRLIEKCGYWRRKEELEDAEEASKSWPVHTRQAVPVADIHCNPEKTEPQTTTSNKLSQQNAESKKETRPMASEPIDVGIIVALREEFSVLHPELPSPVAIKDDDTGTSDYLFQRAVANGTPYFCAATFVGEMGPTEAALATERFCKRRDPKTIVLLGIAAGIDGVKLGDVVIANHVGRYLERAKIVSRKKSFDIKPGGDSFPSSQDLYRAAQNFEFAHGDLHKQWLSSANTLLTKLVPDGPRSALIGKEWLGNSPRLVDGPIASGPVVVAAEEFIKWVKSLNRQYLALEMEGGGVLADIYSHADPKRTMMLRGISDFGDKRKKELDKIGKGGLRRYAMGNAISLLWQLMEAGILPRRARSVNPH